MADDGRHDVLLLDGVEAFRLDGPRVETKADFEKVAPMLAWMLRKDLEAQGYQHFTRPPSAQHVEWQVVIDHVRVVCAFVPFPPDGRKPGLLTCADTFAKK